MPRGPQLNNIAKNFTTRDSLGIEGVVTSIQSELCPIVNTVTPRAFYWPFMIWIYYDFLKYSGIEEHTVKSFDLYLKRQDYFFVLSMLLSGNKDQTNLVGIQKSQEDIDSNPSGPYPFNPNYFVSRYGGMQYYNAGCLSMYFIADKDPENDKDLSFPAIRPEGQAMALAFESKIKDTEYYKSYRRNDKAVPKSVLVEYGKAINLSLKGFDKCKEQLKHFMFNDDRTKFLADRSQRLTECANLIKKLNSYQSFSDIKLFNLRRLLFDHQTIDGKPVKITDDLLPIASKWEVVIGRQYFTSGIEMIWKYMLEQLTEPLTGKEWISQTLNIADFTFDVEESLSDLISTCVFNFDTREEMIEKTRIKNTSTYSIENGLKIILSVYNRFKEHKDIDHESAFFYYGESGGSISLNQMFEKVEEYEDKPIKDFLVFIMQSWLIDQHYKTAFDKMIQGRDGFYYEIIDNRYVCKHEFSLAFQGIRLAQLSQVMRDLEML